MKIVKGFCTWLSENAWCAAASLVLLGYAGLLFFCVDALNAGADSALAAATMAHGTPGIAASLALMAAMFIAFTAAVGFACVMLATWVQDKVDEWIADRAERFRAEARAAEEEARGRDRQALGGVMLALAKKRLLLRLKAAHRDWLRDMSVYLAEDLPAVVEAANKDGDGEARTMYLVSRLAGMTDADLYASVFSVAPLYLKPLPEMLPRSKTSLDDLGKGAGGAKIEKMKKNKKKEGKVKA